MAKLDEETKRLIVTELACFRTPTEVAEVVKETLGIEVDRRQVHEYNPLVAHKAPVAKKWATLFEETRKRFLDSVSDIPIANKAYRLRELQDMVTKAKRAGNLVLAAELMAQAAKDLGGSFTNQRQVTGKDGGPIQTHSQVENLTDEQLDKEFLAMLASLMPANAGPAGD